MTGEDPGSGAGRGPGGGRGSGGGSSPRSGEEPRYRADPTIVGVEDALTGPEADALFTALADATRRRILARVAMTPEDAGNIGRELGITRQAAAKHLRHLEEAGLVTAQLRSRRRIHEVDPRRIREVSELLGVVARGWERRLDGIAREAERRVRD